MILITVNGGGVAVIGDKQLTTWRYMYKNVNVESEIHRLDDLGIFKKMTANGVFKLINKTLDEKNEKNGDKYVCMQ